MSAKDNIRAQSTTEPVAGDPRPDLLLAPMSKTQMIALALIVILNALAGFNALAASFALPGIASQWPVSQTVLGVILSASLAGMAAGAILLSPFADRLGRRPMIITCLLLQASGMLISALSPSLPWLLIARTFTGLGVGGMNAAIIPMAAELANEKRRGLAVGCMAVGYPVGISVGGGAASLLLSVLDWRSIFLFGAALATVLLGPVLRHVPESLDYLLERRPSHALTRINQLLDRIGRPRLTELPTPKNSADPRPVIESGCHRRILLTLASALFCFFLSYYYFNSWLPKIATGLGQSPVSAARISMVASLSGIVSGLAYSELATRVGLHKLAAPTLIVSGALIGIGGHTAPSLQAILAMAIVTGAFLSCGAITLYTLLATSFPARSRVTAAGFCVGVGRLGGVAAPTLAGHLLGHFGLPITSMCLGVGAICSGLLLLLLPPGRSR